VEGTWGKRAAEGKRTFAKGEIGKESEVKERFGSEPEGKLLVENRRGLQKRHEIKGELREKQERPQKNPQQTPTPPPPPKNHPQTGKPSEGKGWKHEIIGTPGGVKKSS